MINYGILAKKPIYNAQKGNDTEYYTLHFTDILFHDHFSKGILYPEEAKIAADLTFYVYDAHRAGCLTKDKNIFLRKCNDDATSEVLFMLQNVKSGKRVLITFSKEMENTLLAKSTDSKVLRYSERKIHKLYGLKKKKK